MEAENWRRGGEKEESIELYKCTFTVNEMSFLRAD